MILSSAPHLIVATTTFLISMQMALSSDLFSGNYQYARRPTRWSAVERDLAYVRLWLVWLLLSLLPHPSNLTYIKSAANGEKSGPYFIAPLLSLIPACFPCMA
jgi:hypothetical protein